MELTSRLDQVTQERGLLQETVRSGQGARGKKEDSRWESQCQRQEERIIELHSVIAELSRKMEETRDDMIKEEREVQEEMEKIQQEYQPDYKHIKHNYMKGVDISNIRNYRAMIQKLTAKACAN